jgi:hypothetical protein
VRRGLALLAVVPLLSGLVACGGDDTDAYCGVVEDHQKELSEIAASGDPDAMLQALDIFEDLKDKAPSDISDEWQQVVGSVEGLEQALDDAGVDPSTYDRDHPPADVTAQQKQAIDDAAATLGGEETLKALQDLDQHARDVCHTPLSI